MKRNQSLSTPAPQKRAGRHRKIAKVGLEIGGVWRQVERDHATGRWSDADLAERHGVKVGTLRARRTRDRKADPAAWAVDLSGDVQRATQAVLTQAALIEAGGQADAVMAAARQIAGVLTGHRKDVQAARGVAMALLEELEVATVGKEGVAEMLEKAGADLDGMAKVAYHAQVRQFMALHSRVGSMAKLAEALNRLQPLERRAFGIPDDDKKLGNPLDAMTERQLEAEIERLQAELALAERAGTTASQPPSSSATVIQMAGLAVKH